MLNVEKALKIAQGIPGWLSDKEGRLLYELAKSCQNPGVIVEIGSFKGRSTVLLGSGSKAGRNVKVYAIDPHTYDMDVVTLTIPKQNKGTITAFLENIKAAKLEQIVIPLNKLSQESVEDVKEPVELLFIDGDHEYSNVKLDYQLWYPKLVLGGFIAFHDNDREGPKKVIKEFLTEDRFINIKKVEHITYAMKEK